MTGILKGDDANTIVTAVGGTDYEFPLVFNSPLSRTANIISISTSSALVSGFLTSSDWTSFNNKISSSSLTATTPLNYDSATGIFTISQASSSVSGYLSSSDWNSFNNKMGSSTISSLTTNYIPKWTGSIFNNSLIFDDGFNIGIGSSSPNWKLSVSGPVAAEYFIATSTTATSTFAGGALFATGAGNLGIGTTSPSQKLSVDGNGYFTGTLGIKAAPNSSYGINYYSATLSGQRGINLDMTAPSSAM
ncbi:MAG: hypothetical protein HY764_04655, partial [Candidatus Portnoybacteria bacterium]|nr:hypothetical protein [Candidatus Portnoybacteria bacterium]